MAKVYAYKNKSNYNFIKMNIEIDYISKFMDDLGDSRTLKLIKLYRTMGWYNNVDFSVLGYSKDGLCRFRAKAVKCGYLKRMKLSDKAGFLYYLNPLYGNRDHVTQELWEAFGIKPGNNTY